MGFHYEDALLILNDLALFHALPVAVKLKMPDTFETKIKKYVERTFLVPTPDTKEGDRIKPPPPMNDFEVYCEILENFDECQIFVNGMRKKKEYFLQNLMELVNKPRNEPFATISHNDMWVNNTMQVVKEDKIVKNKFIDFQTYNYNSAVRDLLLFIGSSIQLPVLQKNFDDLLEYYYRNFLNILLELQCDISTFSRNQFEKELNLEAFEQMYNILMFHRVIFGKKGEAVLMPGKPLQKEDVSDILRERAAALVNIFGRKGWI